jgi:IS30 family transposase
MSEREEISRGLARGDSLRVIGPAIGRSHTTVSREVERNGGRCHYRAERADDAAWKRARRPKLPTLQLNSNYDLGESPSGASSRSARARSRSR